MAFPLRTAKGAADLKVIVWRPGGTLTRPRHGNCSAIAGTWGNGPVHHLSTFSDRRASIAAGPAAETDRSWCGLRS
jgi:hypothetical protein